MRNSNNQALEMAERFQRGEERGFEYFYRQLYTALRYYCFRILNDQDQAEDFVDESFVKLWERHSSFNHPAVIKSWMYTTCRNACLNYLQSEKRKEEHHKIIAGTQEQYEESLANRLIAAETIRYSNDLLDRLPLECRKILAALFIEHKTVREIHEDTGLAISTVKNQKMRGLEILNKYLEWTKLKPNTAPPKHTKPASTKKRKVINIPEANRAFNRIIVGMCEQMGVVECAKAMEMPARDIRNIYYYHSKKTSAA